MVFQVASDGTVLTPPEAVPIPWFVGNTGGAQKPVTVPPAMPIDVPDTGPSAWGAPGQYPSVPQPAAPPPPGPLDLHRQQVARDYPDAYLFDPAVSQAERDHRQLLKGVTDILGEFEPVVVDEGEGYPMTRYRQRGTGRVFSESDLTTYMDETYGLGPNNITVLADQNGLRAVSHRGTGGFYPTTRTTAQILSSFGSGLQSGGRGSGAGGFTAKNPNKTAPSQQFAADRAADKAAAQRSGLLAGRVVASGPDRQVRPQPQFAGNAPQPMQPGLSAEAQRGLYPGPFQPGLSAEAQQGLYPGPSPAYTFEPPGVPSPPDQYQFDEHGNVIVPGEEADPGSAAFSAPIGVWPTPEQQREALEDFTTGHLAGGEWRYGARL